MRSLGDSAARNRGRFAGAATVGTVAWLIPLGGISGCFAGVATVGTVAWLIPLGGISGCFAGVATVGTVAWLIPLGGISGRFAGVATVGTVAWLIPLGGISGRFAGVATAGTVARRFRCAESAGARPAPLRGKEQSCSILGGGCAWYGSPGGTKAAGLRTWRTFRCRRDSVRARCPDRRPTRRRA